jgi:N-methylhydantoinase A/oxoprolinase/acetone carboxylase beta subunit
MTTQRGFRVGFDIGGTFTDFVLHDEQSGALHTYKTLTTPDDPTRAVIEGLDVLLARVDASYSDLSLAIHGTTLITNALIERKGARTALITTCGHRDVLEMAREMRYDIYDLLLVNPEPLVPRPLRLEVSARMDGQGREVRPIDEAELHELATFLEANPVEAVAICLLHAYRNARHEQQIAAFLRARLPYLALSLSAEVAPEIREYERMSTTVANAYVQPLAQRYLLALETQL